MSFLSRLRRSSRLSRKYAWQKSIKRHKQTNQKRLERKKIPLRHFSIPTRTMWDIVSNTTGSNICSMQSSTRYSLVEFHHLFSFFKQPKERCQSTNILHNFTLKTNHKLIQYIYQLPRVIQIYVHIPKHVW